MLTLLFFQRNVLTCFFILRPSITATTDKQSHYNDNITHAVVSLLLLCPVLLFQSPGFYIQWPKIRHLLYAFISWLKETGTLCPYFYGRHQSAVFNADSIKCMG